MTPYNLISPKLTEVKLSTTVKVQAAVSIIFFGILTLMMSAIGIPAFLIAWPFRSKKTEPNSFGWFMLNMPGLFWLWDNDYDGLVGQKNGKNYSKYPLGSFRGCFHWAVLRNPANNWGRYFIGFNYNDCYEIVVDGDWWVAKTTMEHYYRYKGFGWKIEPSRHTDRPWCGFGYRAGK